MKKEVLRMEHVYVKKTGRFALEDFHLNIFEGEFLFVYGFSDSGIRELGEILKGSRKAEKGFFYVNERKVSPESFSDPGQYGIYIIQNRNNLVDDLSISENLFFGGKKKYFQRVVSRQKQEMMAERLLEKFDLKLDIHQNPRSLKYYERILIKTIMAYVRGARIVVFDSIIGLDISKEDRYHLEKAIRLLREDGISVLWLNQQMDSAAELADRVNIMYRGRNNRNIYRESHAVLDELRSSISDMEKSLRNPVPAKETDPAGRVFDMESVCGRYISDISFYVKKGELLCLTSRNSLMMAELRDIISGAEQNYSGDMSLEGNIFHPADYYACISQGVCYLDMMWFEKHCNPDMSITDNLLMDTYWKSFGLYGVMHRGMREHIRTLYRMKHPDWPSGYWRNLTVDQQKVLLLEKLTMIHRKLVIITEPFFQLNSTMLEQFTKLIYEIRDNNDAVILMAATEAQCGRISDRVIRI